MASDGARLVEKFFPGTGSTYDDVVRATTLGLDAYWKRCMFARFPKEPRAVLDLACGTGIVTFEILRRWPKARVVGVDVTEDYLAVAREKHRRLGGDVTFLLGLAETTKVEGPFDCVCSSYLPKYVDPDRLLENVLPALRPGGVFVVHDFSYPPLGPARAGWQAYFALLDPLMRRAKPEWANVFDHSLRDLIRTTPWVSRFRAALRRRGCALVRVEPLAFGTATVVSARKR
jgi:demethylmenaquinone methyltransferase/2-methoxy-6-polyprenyl-1,4-benzoquinol methylase